MLTKENARAMVDKISAYTKHYALITITDTEENTTRFANSEINQHVSVSDTKLSLTLYDGKKEAACATNVLSDEGLSALTQTAEDMLPFVPEGAYEAFPLSRDSIRESSGNERLVEAYGVRERVEHIKAGVSLMEDGFTSAGALVMDRHVLAIGDNRGGFRYGACDRVRFNTVVTHTDGAAGSAECGSCDEIPNIADAFAKACKTARQARNPIGINTGAYTVVLSPYALGDLMEFTAYLLNAKQVDDGYSYAIGKLNEKIFGENIYLRDDVHHTGTLPLYFDAEGTPRKSVDIIEKGVLKSFLHDNKSAAKHKTKSTGHAVNLKGAGGYPRNLVMAGGTQTLDEIIAGTDKGIFINEFHYTNLVNPRALQITGLTRNGTFLIENGKLTRPITTMRFTQNFIESLNRITALSVERVKIVSPYSIHFMPGARIEGFHFTGKQ
jgi:predicted Zn-dependent protease